MSNEVQALEAVEKVKSFINKKEYREARFWISKARKLFPELENVLEMLIVCETLYYGGMDFLCCGVDWYSVLHLHSSSAVEDVKTRCEMLISYTTIMKNMSFPGAVEALQVLNQAESVVCNHVKHREYVHVRHNSESVDSPCIKSASSFEQEYLDWKPPALSLDVTDYLPLQNKTSKAKVPISLQTQSELVGIISRMTILFDDMPQDPHYAPLKKYTACLREGMKTGADIAFSDLCETILMFFFGKLKTILMLEDPQHFLSKSDWFKEQLNQFQEMGYNVEKPRERLDNLEKVAVCHQVSQDTLEKFETEVRDHEARIDDLKWCILKLEAQVELSKGMVVEGRNLVAPLKNYVKKLLAEFTSAAKASFK